jgi:hypothetical protein
VTVRELVEHLQRFPHGAEVVLSAGGHVAMYRPNDEAVVVLADRARFAGRLPDMILTT